MMERLYQPDYSCIFGEKYANAFLYSQIDSLVWPIFTDVEKSQSLKNLLSLKNSQKSPYFYHRTISIADEKIELECSNLQCALLQAMDLGREYGISNEDVVRAVKQDPDWFKGILSFSLTSDNKDIALSEVKRYEKEITVAGIALYPSFTRLDLNDGDNRQLQDLLEYCTKRNLFLKIDIGNMSLPGNYPEFTSYETLKSFFSNHPQNIFVLSGLDLSGDFHLHYQLIKSFKNVWLEIDPRTFGGSTPTASLQELFSTQGVIQNCWSRMILGSATPTLEASQVVRGLLEATESLPFAQKCILRTWAFRNGNRLNYSHFKPIQTLKSSDFRKVIEIGDPKIVENESEVNLIYKIRLRSYSITQLLFLTDMITQIVEKSLKKYPNLQNGELFLRSYHTTTSLLINEHEFGNYLDLHFQFAEISQQDSSKFLHTVRAQENRADFNHYDHELASTYGNRQLILPILNRTLEIVGRENFYVLVTFGPRTFNLFLRIRMIKE